MVSPLAQTLAEARALHQAGQRAEAEKIYRAVIAAEPGNADALHLCAALCLERGATDEAIGLIRSGLAIDPDNPTFHCNLGAAQVAAMDLAISTSNTTVHMAGALGVPVWTLLPRTGLPLSYWFLGRDDCPWYRSMRLFRQQRQGDWPGLLRRVGRELEENYPEPGAGAR